MKYTTFDYHTHKKMKSTTKNNIPVILVTSIFILDYYAACERSETFNSHLNIEFYLSSKNIKYKYSRKK